MYVRAFFHKQPSVKSPSHRSPRIPRALCLKFEISISPTMSGPKHPFRSLFQPIGIIFAIAITLVIVHTIQLKTKLNPVANHTKLIPSSYLPRRLVKATNKTQKLQARAKGPIVRVAPQELVDLCLQLANDFHQKQNEASCFLGYHFMKSGPNFAGPTYDLTLLDGGCQQIGESSSVSHSASEHAYDGTRLTLMNI